MYSIIVTAKNYLGALRQAGLEGELIYESRKPLGASTKNWDKYLSRMSRNSAMQNRLRGLHSEIKKKYSRILIEDYRNMQHAWICAELTGNDLKHHKKEIGCLPYSKQQAFHFYTNLKQNQDD